MPRSRALAAIAALLLAGMPAAGDAESPAIPPFPVLFTGRVVDSGAVLRHVASLDLRLRVERVSTWEQILDVSYALAGDGPLDLYGVLHAQPSAGWVTVGSESRGELRMVQWLQTGQGAVLRAVTDRRLPALGVLNGPAREEYPVAMVEIRFDPHGDVADASLLRAVDLSFAPDGTLEARPFDPQPFRLELVAR